MDLQYFKAIIEEDRCAVVICDLEHTIIYMNPAAKDRWHRDLTGQNLFACHNADSREKIGRILEWFRESKEHNRVHTFFNEKQQKDGYMIALRDEAGALIGYYEKHEYRIKDETPFYEMESN